MALSILNSSNVNADKNSCVTPSWDSTGATAILVSITTDDTLGFGTYSTLSLTDSESNTYTLVSDPIIGTDHCTGFFLCSSPVNSATLTVTFTETNSDGGLAVFNMTAMAIGGTLDASPTYGYNKTTSSTVGATVNTVGDMIIGACSSVSPLTFGTGQTVLHNSPSWTGTTYEIPGSTGADTQSFGGGISWGTICITLKEDIADVTAPVLQSATVENASPADLVLTYDEALDTGSTPATGDFTNFAPTKTVTGVVVSGLTVTITVSVAWSLGDVIDFDYTAATNPIQDVAGNDAANLTNQAVTNNILPPPSVVEGSFATYSGSGQAYPGAGYSTIDVGSENVDADGLVTEAAGVFTPSTAGYYLILAEGRFDATHNNRANIAWKVQKNATVIAGAGGSGYERNSTNQYAYMTCRAILLFNGTTDTFEIRHRRDIGAGTPAGTYGATNLKLIYLGASLPYARYQTPTAGAFSGATATAIAGWDVVTESDTAVIELQAGGTAFRLKEANRPYLIIYGLENSDAGSLRTTRVSDVTLAGTRIGHSAGYAYQRDSTTQYARPNGIALVYPTSANQDVNIRCWGYDDDAATLWGTFSTGAWTLDSSANTSGVMIIALPATTDVAIYDDTVGGDTISGAATTDLTIIDTEVKAGTNFTKDSVTDITVASATDVLAIGTIMVERTASNGTRNTSAIRWELEGVDQTDTEQGEYLRGEQGTNDTKNMAITSIFTGAVASSDTFQLEKFDPGTDDGAFDEVSWGGAFFIDLETLIPATALPRRLFVIT